MTAQTTVTDPTPSWLAVNGLKLIKFGGLGFIALASFAAAFTHMHDWTAEALPAAADWLCWSNAIISEILPTVSFILWRERDEAGRPAGTPLSIFLGSVVLSIFAQLSATGVRFPHDAQLLVCLPAIALLVIAKVALGDLSYARKAQLKAAAEARKAAELARKQAAREAELAAEQARKAEREQTELAAELARQAAEHAAELDRQQSDREAAERLRLAEIEQAAITRRAEIEAAERAEQRSAARARELREEQARQAREAEAARIRAEADADRVRAEAARLEAEAEAKRQATALLAGRHSASGRHSAAGHGGAATVSPIRVRRPREATQALADAALAVQPAGTTRDSAVRAVAQAIGNTERYAREFVPPDWAPSSVPGAEDHQAGALAPAAAGSGRQAG